METTISEIRSIVQRRRELEIEDQRLNDARRDNPASSGVITSTKIELQILQ